MEVIGSRSLGIVGLFHLFGGRIQPTYTGVRTSIDPEYHGHPSSLPMITPTISHPDPTLIYYFYYLYRGERTCIDPDRKTSQARGATTSWMSQDGSDRINKINRSIGFNLKEYPNYK